MDPAKNMGCAKVNEQVQAAKDDSARKGVPVWRTHKEMGALSTKGFQNQV